MKKAALITGASSGIGAATARLFSEKGYFVYLLGRNEDRLHEVALQCTSGASLLKADLNNPAQVDKYTQHLFERKDTDLQVLINNAGIFERKMFAEDTDLEHWRLQFETNLFGRIRLTQKVLPLFLGKKSGSIVNVSSTVGLRPVQGISAYSASKAAMINWTQSLALELGPQGIRVNCVAPGIVDTPIHSFHSAKNKNEALEQMASLQPLGRIGTAEEVAEAIYFLASPASAWTTGVTLPVDGGIQLT